MLKMIQISVVSGKNAGKSFALKKFPAIIGRDSKADVLLDDEGVWDKHCQISYNPCDGFYISAFEPATLLLNGQPVQKSRLRNGDSITAGSAKFQFWLAEVKPKDFRIRETLTWLFIISLFFVQVLIIYKIIRIIG